MGEDVVARSVKLDKKIVESSAEIGAFVDASKRTQRFVRLLAISVGLDFALTIGLGVVAIRAEQAISAANSARSQARAACLADNQARSGQIQLWDYIVTTETSPTQTLQEQQRMRSFQVYVHQLFAPRKCG